MRTHVEFVSDAFPAEPGEEEEINPGRWGRRLADMLVAELPKHGVKTGEPYAEDWGWVVDVRNESFPMFVGCGNLDGEEGDNHYLCFIDPSKPEVRKGLFKKVSTVADVERVASALDAVLRAHPGIREVRWSEPDAV